jgi:hypothetical protein
LSVSLDKSCREVRIFSYCSADVYLTVWVYWYLWRCLCYYSILKI